MNTAALAGLALSMSMDGFAASLGGATALQRARASEALRTGLVFGVVSTATPLVGWCIGTTAALGAVRFNPWIAFGVLSILGAKTAAAALFGRSTSAMPARQPFKVLLATAVATSLDALAVGITLAFVKADIVAASVAIGGTTFMMAIIGTLIGRWVGPVFGRGAAFAGGACLIGVGAKILTDNW